MTHDAPKHSPLPWAIHDGGRFGEYGDLGPSICAENGDTCDVCRANAELIHRVNTWEGLRDALQRIAASLDPDPLWADGWGGECCYGNYDDAHNHGIAIGETRQAGIARAALEAAEEGA